MFRVTYFKVRKTLCGFGHVLVLLRSGWCSLDITKSGEIKHSFKSM
jgi:hypothetical protein